MISEQTALGSFPEDLDQSLPLEPMRLRTMASQQDALKELLTHLVATHPSRLTAAQKDDLRSVYRQILINVIYNSIRRMYTALPRGTAAFTPGTYWSKLGLTFKFTIAALDRLVEDEYIQQFKGVYNGPGGFSRLTRIWASDKLSSAVDIEAIANATEFLWDEDAAPVVLKDFPYRAESLGDDHPDVSRVRSINAFLKHHNWPQRSPIRIIYNTNPMYGGRVYTRFQNMKRELRAKMRIDGKPTVELDFKANHLMMLIAMEGLPLPYDPYQAIAEVAKVERRVVKQFTTVALGASNERNGFKALNSEGLTNQTINEVMSALLMLYPGVPLFRGLGTALQSLEGQIALDVMYQGAQAGIVVLPVHDSFITTADNKEWLKKEMINQWTHHVKEGVMTRVEEK